MQQTGAGRLVDLWQDLGLVELLDCLVLERGGLIEELIEDGLVALAGYDDCDDDL